MTVIGITINCLCFGPPAIAIPWFFYEWKLSSWVFGVSRDLDFSVIGMCTTLSVLGSVVLGNILRDIALTFFNVKSPD